MNIGIDIDGVLTNHDDYILDFTSKYCYEHNLKGLADANLYEYRKLDWSENIINDYRKEYFLNYVKSEPARRFASEVIKKLRKDGHKIFIISARYKTAENGKINNENIRECPLFYKDLDYITDIEKKKCLLRRYVLRAWLYFSFYIKTIKKYYQILLFKHLIM